MHRDPNQRKQANQMYFKQFLLHCISCNQVFWQISALWRLGLVEPIKKLATGKSASCMRESLEIGFAHSETLTCTTVLAKFRKSHICFVLSKAAENLNMLTLQGTVVSLFVQFCLPLNLVYLYKFHHSLIRLWTYVCFDFFHSFYVISKKLQANVPSITVKYPELCVRGDKIGATS